MLLVILLLLGSGIAFRIPNMGDGGRRESVLTAIGVGAVLSALLAFGRLA